LVDAKVTEQLDCGAVRLWTSRQAAKGVLLPSAVKVTVPSGAVLVPASVSVTVAVHSVEPPAWKDGGVQLTVVEVERFVTVTLALPELPKCVVSPPYSAVIVWVPLPTAVAV
jgi:hypothetical protein